MTSFSPLNQELRSWVIYLWILVQKEWRNRNCVFLFVFVLDDRDWSWYLCLVAELNRTSYEVEETRNWAIPTFSEVCCLFPFSFFNLFIYYILLYIHTQYIIYLIYISIQTILIFIFFIRKGYKWFNVYTCLAPNVHEI